MAVGLLNVSAIAIISERYKGKERVQTLGIRGSAEVVGTAVLTFGVSLLIRFGWQAAFLVYGISSYLTFVSLICALWIYDGSSGGKTPGCQDDGGTMADCTRLSGRCGSYRLVQCHDHRSDSKCGRTSWTWHCPNCRGYISSHAICGDLGRFGLLALDLSIP